MKAYELLDKPEKWTQGMSSFDKNKNPIHPNNENAVSWCVIGAIYKCYPEDTQNYIFDIISNKLNNPLIGEWNDCHTYEEVFNLLKELDI